MMGKKEVKNKFGTHTSCIKLYMKIRNSNKSTTQFTLLRTQIYSGSSLVYHPRVLDEVITLFSYKCLQR